MTANSKKVLQGYLALTENEKEEVKSFIIEYERLGYFQKGERSRQLNESRVVGPVSSNACPCCGK